MKSRPFSELDAKQALAGLVIAMAVFALPGARPWGATANAAPPAFVGARVGWRCFRDISRADVDLVYR